MFENLNPFQLRSIDPVGFETAKELSNPYYHPISTRVEFENSGNSQPNIVMYFIDHNDQIRPIAQLIDAESADINPNSIQTIYKKYDKFKFRILKGQSDIKLRGEEIKAYAIDFLNECTKRHTSIRNSGGFDGMMEHINNVYGKDEYTQYRELEIRLFMNESEFNIVCQTCANGIPPFVKFNFSSSKLINFSDLDDECDIFEKDVDFYKILQMTVDIEYAYDHAEKFNPKPKSIWEKIFGR